MAATTLFTWGYYGWGNATHRLLEAVDAVETGRGFEPPIFVDTRIRRTVRATGFVGNAFEKLLGSTRHRWMKSLGNRFIVTRTGPHIQIAEPSAAHELLDLALKAGEHTRRVLFFCGCQWPRRNGEIACHRSAVAELVLQAARGRGASIEIVEWPGGQPKRIDLDVTPDVSASVRKGRKTVPLRGTIDVAQIGGLAWGSIATIRSEHDELHRVVGPALWQTDQWSLPVFPLNAESLPESEQAAARLRQSLGLEPAST